MSFLIVALVALPLLMAGLVMAMRSSAAWRAGCVLAGLMALVSTGLAIAGMERAVELGATPWGGHVGLALTPLSSWLVAAVFWCALIVDLAPLWRPTADGPPASPALDARWRSGARGLGWALIAAVNAALLVDDLIARVVALDLASLLLALMLLLFSSRSLNPLSAIWDYVLLRVGDLSFLLVALWLAVRTGTFAIEAAFAQAATLPGWHLALALIAGGLAVWVKLGISPLGSWAEAVAEMPFRERALILSAAQPLLGFYLLYRLQPAIEAAGVWGRALLVALAALLVAVSLAPLRADRSPILRWLTAHSALGLLAVAVGLSRPYLMTFVAARLALSLAIREPESRVERLATATDSWRALPRPVQALVNATARGEQALESGVAWLGAAPARVGAGLQRLHTGRLRHNLLLAALALPPLLVVMLGAMLWAMRSAP